MTKPLQGITVVAVEQAVAAPLCTARLVDGGARVIKIERESGDFARGYDGAAHGDSSYFAWANHGKESLVLDIKDADDASLLHRIVASADVFVQNLAPGALDRAGFGAATLQAANPRLITCDISGYGEQAGLAEKKAYDLLVQAESGLIGISGGPGELGRVGISLCDIGAGVTAHAAILEALIARSVSGEGAQLGVSLFDVAAEWMTVPLVQHHHGGTSPTRVGLKHPTIAPYGAFATAEGALTLLSIQNEREWARLCTDVLDMPDLATDKRFASNTERVQNRVELEETMNGVIGTLSQDEFLRRLDLASIANGSVNGLDDVVAHQAMRWRTINSTTGTQVTLPAHPVRNPSAARDNPLPSLPTIGQHTEAIRSEFSA